MNPAIVLFSHGSLLCGSGERLRVVAEQMRAIAVDRIVEIGFLNYNEPRFETAIERCVARGATAVTIAPYFLAAGKFVTGDLPPKVEWARRHYPQLAIAVAEPLRAHVALADAVMQCALRAVPPQEWRDLLKMAPRFCEARHTCPLYGGTLCPAGQGKAIEIAQQGPPSANSAQWASESPPARYPSDIPTSGKTFERTYRASAGDPEKTGLVVMVHGSPRAESNDDMFEVVADVRRREVYDAVEVGFLECNEPSIAVALDRCVASGAGRVVAVPYFLHPGRHVADDLPALLEAARGRHADVEFLMGDYLGHAPAIADTVLARVWGVETIR